MECEKFLRNKYDTWLSDLSGHEYTKGGNLKPPSRSLLCEWVKASWELIPVETIKKLFISCAITTQTDGRDDDKIHCFKPGQPCAAGKSLLFEQMENLHSSTHEFDCDDPFGSESGDEETEENEACIDSDDHDSDGEDRN